MVMFNDVVLLYCSICFMNRLIEELLNKGIPSVLSIKRH